MASTPSRWQLDLIATIARTHSDESVRDLAREDLLGRALASPSSYVNQIIRACVLGEHRVPRDGQFWGALEKSLERAERTTVDLLIVTVKAPELDAARDALGVGDRDFSQDGPRGSRFWEFAIPRGPGQSPLSAALTVVGEAQNYKMSSFMHLVMGKYQPRLCILLGTAAGRKVRGARLGNVVVASEVVDYASARLTEDGYIPEPTSYSCRADFTRPLASLRTTFRGEWHSRIHEVLTPSKLSSSGRTWPNSLRRDPISYAPDIGMGVILAGDLIVEDGSLPSRAVDLRKRRAMAAEMEGAGFAHFVRRLICHGWCSGVSLIGARPEGRRTGSILPL